jgi:hypothetical protein
MPELACHCGAVRIAFEPAPHEVTDCNCSICRRYGALWAYYERPHVEFRPPHPATDIYCWGDKDLEFHRCKTCGCVTHWVAVDKTKTRMGLNMRHADPSVLAAARVRRLDGADTWADLGEN